MRGGKNIPGNSNSMSEDPVGEGKMVSRKDVKRGQLKN